MVSEEVLTLQETIEQMRKEREEEKANAQKENQTKAYQAELSRIKNEVLTNKENFELVAYHDDHIDLVKQVLDEGKENGNELTVQQAAKMVEDYLEGRAREFAKVPKLRKLFGVVDNPQVPADNGARESSTQSQPKAASTLTNLMTQQSGVGTEREMTEEERRAKAAEILRFVD